MSSLHLSSEDAGALTRIQAALLTTSPQRSLEAYLRETNRMVQEVVGATVCVYSYPQDGETRHVVPQVSSTLRGVYSELIPHIQRRFKMDVAHKQLRVWSRRNVYGSDLTAYHKTAYYNEFLVPQGGHDAVGLTLSTPEIPYLAQIFGVPHMLSATEEAHRLNVLRLLYPAFRAGALNMYRAQRALQDQARLLDAVPVAAALFSASRACLLHQSATLRQLLAQSKQAARLAEEIAAAARHASLSLEVGQSRATRTVVLDLGVYELTASRVRAGALASSPCLLVVAHPRTPRWPSVDTVCQQSGLTRREAEIALLLCHQLTNRAIAERLKLSRHTVRHHIAHILDKLAIHSRDEVPNILLSPGMAAPHTS